MNGRRRSKLLQPIVRWLGEKVKIGKVNPFTKQYTTFEGFEFGDIRAYVGDYIMVSNADADEPDTFDGCDVARINHLFESSGKGDKYRANVQWYSKPSQMPHSVESDHLDDRYEVVEEFRKFDSNVDIETVFKKCTVIVAYEDENPEELCKKNKSIDEPLFVCRYRLFQKQKKFHLEPVLKLDIGVSNSDTPTKNDENRRMKNTPNTPIVQKRVEKHVGNCTERTPRVSRVTRDINNTSNYENDPVIVLSDIKLKSVLRKMSVDSDSETPRGATPRKVTRVAIGPSNRETVRSPKVKSKENLDYDSENSQTSAPRKNTKSETPLKSNSVNMLMNAKYYPDIENSPSNIIANGNNEVFKSTPQKILSNNANRKRKPSRSKSTSESSLEPRSRSISPEILSTGPPAMYKLYEKSGQSLIIRKPINFETKAQGKLNDLDISGMLESDSEKDCDVIFDKLIQSGAKIVARSKTNETGKFELLSSPNNRIRTPKNNEKESKNCTPKSARRDLSNALSVENNTPKTLLMKKVEQKCKDVSLRIKLRRSTEQSNYKIDSDSDCDVSRRKTMHGTPKSILKMNPKWSGSPSVRVKLNANEGAINSVEQVDGGSSLELLENQGVRKSRRIRTPSAKYLDNEDATNHVSNRNTPRRSRRSINYNEDHLFRNFVPLDKLRPATRSSRSVNRVTCNDNSDSDASIDKSDGSMKESKSKLVEKNLTVSPRSSRRPRKDSRTKAYDENEQEDDYTDAVVTKPCSRVTTVKAQGDTLIIKSDSPVGRSKSTSIEEKRKMTPRSECGPRKDGNTKNDDYEVLLLEEHDDDEEEEEFEAIITKPRISVATVKAHGSVPGTPRRSSRVTCRDDCSSDNDLQLRGTPRRGKKLVGADISTPSRKNAKTQGERFEPTTPKRSVGTPRSQTPANAVKNGLLTPSMLKRNASVVRPATALQEARARLHVSAVPKSLPCREEEFNNIYTFLEGKLLDNSGGCIYISGVPGTGKTATVNECIRCLRKSIVKGAINNFECIEINGMKLTEPRQAYVHILKQLTGKTATWEQAHRLLDNRFTRPAPRRLMTLLLVDELDVLCNKRQDVVYNLLDWPTKTSAQLVVITIANTMDLPERVLMGRVTSRLGLTRLTFQPYTHKQLQEIVTARLKDSDAFKSEAVQLVARKVAAVSGDARRALDICRRATEIAELNASRTVSMQDVNQALTEMIASAKVQAIRRCSEMERTFLQAVCAEVARTGVEEASFNNIYIQLAALCSFEGLKVPTVTEALIICGRLGGSRLLICEHSRTDIHQRILLNVSSDDVHFSMQSMEF